MKPRILFLLLCLTTPLFAAVKLTTQQQDDHTVQATMHVDVAESETIYTEYLQLSTDHPGVEVVEWHMDREPAQVYDTAFKENKKVHTKSFNIVAQIKTTSAQPIEDAHLHLTYHSNERVVQEYFELPLAAKLATNIDIAPVKITPEERAATAVTVPTPDECAPSASWSGYLSTLVKTTESIWVQLLLVFLLGLLMSLTPCVYPMIPITVGILQSQGSKSVIKNFLLALSYTVGISTTFAMLGLIAALSGNIFGQILMNPLFVIALVAALGYLAFSMLGYYEMYIPRFMQGGGTAFKGGSFFTAFSFGLVSGSVASPCLSPGLALLLSVVATLGNKLLGFTLLFAFGIGLSVPLLIIGTFSGSINVLPKSGMWMVEIKKLFGFMLLGLCVFYLQNIMPWYLLAWLLAGGVLAAGIYYLQSIKDTDSKFWRHFKNVCGIGCIAASLLLFVKAYQTTFHPVVPACATWFTDYECAQELACREKKNLFIKFGSAFCSLCTAIDKKLLSDPDVICALENVVTLKIDASQLDEEPYKSIKENYNIIGFPTFLLLNPQGDTLIKRWEGELYSMPKECFIEEITAR